MSTVSAGRTRAGDWQLRRHWAAADPWLRVLLLHGLNEHSGRYEHVGDALSAAGIDVRAHDNRGHGRTWGRRSYVGDFDEFLDDVEDHLAELRAEGDVPLAIVGHSMGGLIAHAYCVSGRPLPDLLVTSGAALEANGVSDWQRRLAGILARFAPELRVGGKIDGAVLSRDPEVGRAYHEDPLVPTGVTAALGQAMLDGMDFHRRRAAELAIPTLVLHGGADELVKPEATEPLEQLDAVERHVLADMRHEVFNEIGYEDVVAQVIGWLRSREKPVG